jgi:hypothetical protein
MQHFASDNYAGICPEALDALIAANNSGHEPAYGDDSEVDPQKRTPILLKRRCRNGQASYPVPGGIPGADG